MILVTFATALMMNAGTPAEAEELVERDANDKPVTIGTLLAENISEEYTKATSSGTSTQTAASDSDADVDFDA